MGMFEKLNEINQNIKDHPELMKDLISTMKSEEIQNFIHPIIDNYQMDKNDAPLVKTIIDCAQTIYNYSGESTGLSDSEYDVLYELLTNIDGEIGITVPIVSKGKTGYHKFKSLRGTLDKVYALSDDDELENKSRRSLDDWIKSSEAKIKAKTGKNVDLNDEEIYVFPKFDGVSAIFEFDSMGNLERVLTRGFTETNEAQDITHLFNWVGKDWVNGIPIGKPYGLKTEIMMSDEDFEKYNAIYNSNYKQSRSIVSSIINSDEADDRVKYLQIMQLRYSYLEDGEESLQKLAPGAFNTPYIRCRLSDRDAIRKFASEHKYANGLRCDGAVIYIINEELQKILGRENDKQKFEVAYKFTEESAYSKIKDIKFTAGLFGRINPVAVIKPVKLKGNTIENVSLGSMGRFKELNLAKGDKVKILYDIIPYLVYDNDDEHCKRSGENPIEMPWCCPECGKPLEFSDSGDMCYCINKDCPCKKKGKILNFFNRMNIDGISYATVDTFYREGYLEKIEDVYKLKDNYKKLCKLDGFGKRSIDLIINAIEEHRDVPASQMLGSIGIENVSTKTFEKVLQMITFDELMELSLNEEGKAVSVLTLVPGIKDKTARKIIQGIKENEKLIEFLEEELIILQEPKSRDYKYTVVFTKVRDEELEKWTETHEGKVLDSLTKDTSVLVVPVLGVESSKVSKAEKYGIPIVPIADYKKYVMDNFIEVPF
jgi:DNA ligase (NAD+)